MIELKADRIDQILHAETGKKEELNTILRGLYTRYMTLYEKYFADIEALNDEEIASLKSYHEETRSLLRYYFLDVPQDICRCLIHFDEEYTDKLLGSEWHKYLFDNYKEFKEDYTGKNKSKQNLKAEFAKQTEEACILSRCKPLCFFIEAAIVYIFCSPFAKALFTFCLSLR